MAVKRLLVSPTNWRFLQSPQSSECERRASASPSANPPRPLPTSQRPQPGQGREEGRATHVHLSSSSIIRKALSSINQLRMHYTWLSVHPETRTARRARTHTHPVADIFEGGVIIAVIISCYHCISQRLGGQRLFPSARPFNKLQLGAV